MLKSKPKILIISSADPTVGPGVLSANYYDAYKHQGYDVDLLTLKKCNSRPEFFYVYDDGFRIRRSCERLKSLFSCIKDILWAVSHNCQWRPKPGYYFFYHKEDSPPIPVSKVLSKITKQYDVIHLLFWQGMLSFKTVREIYRKQKCFFIFNCVDYSPMSGGCHFTGDCERYKIGCGNCPAFNSKNPKDFTWFNVQYRKKVYDEVKPLITGNSYMFGFYDQSILLHGRKRIIFHPLINLEVFHPMDKIQLYAQYGISSCKKFKMLFGCQSIDDERKGIRYLIEAINIFTAKLTESERSEVLVMAIGKNFGAFKQQLNDLDTRDFGFVSINELPFIYSLADVFLCPSVNDAGPMMVNQSLCCGTPVVGFEMGACLDAVKNQGTGYCAELRDSKGFALGIEKIYRQTQEERRTMQRRCVEFAKKTYSYEVAVKRMIDGYERHKCQQEN